MIDSESLKILNNLTTKSFYRKALVEDKNHNDRKAWIDDVWKIGKEWNALHLWDDETSDAVAKYLWTNLNKILDGSFKIGVHAYPYSHGVKNKQTKVKEAVMPVFESKICFLLNPSAYKLVFDSRNRKSIKELVKKDKFKYEDASLWSELVKNFYKENLSDLVSRKSDYDIVDSYFWLRNGGEYDTRKEKVTPEQLLKELKDAVSKFKKKYEKNLLG